MAKKLDGYSFTLFSIIFIYLSFKAAGFTLTIFNFSISIAYDKDDGILFETSAQQNEYKKWKQQERKERAERDKRLYGNTEWKTEPFDPKKKY